MTAVWQTWRCPRCGYTTRQKGANAVFHRCGAAGTHQPLQPVDEREEEED